MRAISPDLQPLTSVVIAVLDANGVLLEASAGFMEVLGKGPGRYIGANVSAYFGLPAFADIAASQPFPNGDVYRGAMRFRVGEAEGPLHRGRIWRSAFGLCLQAELAGTGKPVVEARVADGQARPGAGREARRVDPGSTDRVTGVGTRASLELALAQEADSVRAGGFPFCLFLVKLERFEEVVARHGAAGGDKALARLGYLLRLLTRPSDLTARSDAHEFAVLLPHTNPAQAASAVERIGKVLKSDVTEPLPGPVPMRFGMAEYRDGEDSAALMSRARAAMMP